MEERKEMNAPARPDAITTLQEAPRAITLGEWCVQRGLITRAQVDECLAAQRSQQERGVPPSRLGQILLERGFLTTPDLLRALSSQRREIRHCPGCRLQTTVPVGSGVSRHSCPTCKQFLIPSPDAGSNTNTEFFVGAGREEYPEEVRQAALSPASRFGKYILIRELGHGGVGRVFLAWDTFLSQFVAVKRLRTDLGGQSADLMEERRRMLVREARSAIRLRHAGIVTVYDVGRIDEELYISMEFVDGETLHDHLQSTLRIGHAAPYFSNPPLILRILSEVARAIDHAHTRPAPLIHCDLKPSNIMIDRDSHARILDFGLARNLQTDAGEPSEYVSGTPGYMAPEQARGDAALIDARTDIYAFGAILYECLTGRTPFIGAAFEILHQTLSATPESPSIVLKTGPRAEQAASQQIPAPLESLCMLCLERDPGRRPFFLGDLAATLEGLAAPAENGPSVYDAPFEEPPTPIVRPSLSPRPSRRTAGLLTAALVLTLGLGLSSLAWTRTQSAADIGNFLPERAEQSYLAGRRDEGLIVAALKARLIARLRSPIPSLTELHLKGNRSLTILGIASAGPEGLVVATSYGTLPLAWESLEPGQILTLIRLTLPEPTPEDRLALGIYALRAGLPDEARRNLLSLRSTPRAAQAERFLGEVQP